MKRIFSIIIGSMLVASATWAQSKVYVTRDLSPESLVRIYQAVGRKAEGRVAVKISTGESEKTGYLRPQFIKPLLDEVNGTIVTPVRDKVIVQTAQVALIFRHAQEGHPACSRRSNMQ